MDGLNLKSLWVQVRKPIERGLLFLCDTTYAGKSSITVLLLPPFMHTCALIFILQKPRPMDDPAPHQRQKKAAHTHSRLLDPVTALGAARVCTDGGTPSPGARMHVLVRGLYGSDPLATPS